MDYFSALVWGNTEIHSESFNERVTCEARLWLIDTTPEIWKQFRCIGKIDANPLSPLNVCYKTQASLLQGFWPVLLTSTFKFIFDIYLWCFWNLSNKSDLMCVAVGSNKSDIFCVAVGSNKSDKICVAIGTIAQLTGGPQEGL